MPSRSRFSLEINWKSRFARGNCCKVFLGKTIRHHLRIHNTTRKHFLEYYDSCFSQNTIQNIWKISSFFSMPSCSPCLCSFIFTDPVRICGVTMSHTWNYSWCKRKVVFFNFFIYFCSFRSFQWFRFGRFARFGGFVSAGFVSLFRVLVHAQYTTHVLHNILHTFYSI